MSRYEHWRMGGADNVMQSSSFDLGDEIIAALLVKFLNRISNCFHSKSTIEVLLADSKIMVLYCNLMLFDIIKTKMLK